MTPDELVIEKRLRLVESELAMLKHELEMKDIIKPSSYPPYIPWTTPSPIESMFTPSRWQAIEIRERNKN